MSEQINENINNEKGFFGKTVGVFEKAAEAGYEVEKFKVRAAHAVEDGIAEAKRFVKKGEYAAEDLMDDTAHLIKHEPFRSVGVTFGVGLGLGIFAGWLLTRRTKDTDQ